MGDFFSKLNVPYLLILMGVSVGVILLLWLAQRLALKRLSKALYGRGDVAAYNAMLDKLPYRLVLRRATAGLLRLEGAIFSGDAEAVWQAAERLEDLRLKPGEKLSWYRKALAFAVTTGDGRRARQYLERLQALLQNEKDPKLREILDDAQLLVGVYVERDTALAGRLRELAGRQQGGRKGLTLYRLAKLYHFAGKPETAAACLREAMDNLEGSAWRQVAARALEDPAILEVE